MSKQSPPNSPSTAIRTGCGAIGFPGIAVMAMLFSGLVSGLLAGIPFGDAWAQTKSTTEQLKDVQSTVEKEKSRAKAARGRSETIARDIDKLRNEMVVAAKAVQSHEQRVETISARMQELEKSRDTRAAELQESRKKFARVLFAMQRIAQFPPEALIVQPTVPADTIRTAIMLRATVGEIDKQAEILRTEVAFFAKTRAEIAVRGERLRETAALLDRERRRLGALMSRKKVLKRRADKQAFVSEQRVAALGKKAKSLRELLKGLDAEKNGASNPGARNRLLPPKTAQNPRCQQPRPDCERSARDAEK